MGRFYDREAGNRLLNAVGSALPLNFEELLKECAQISSNAMAQVSAQEKQKFANQKVRQKGSSPKFSVFNTALMSAQAGKTFKQAREDRIFWGRLVESSVGAYLLNSIRGTQIEIFYWREGGDKEVDFVLRHGKSITAIEVKSGQESIHQSGMDLFVSKFKPDRVLLVGDQGIPIEKFFLTPLSNFIPYQSVL